LSKQWVTLGYQVTIFNNCSAQEGNYDGVNYLSYDKFNPFDTYNILIIWRYPWRLNQSTKAHKIYYT